MRTAIRSAVVVSWVLTLGVGLAQAEQAKISQSATDPGAKEAAMKAMMAAGSPSEGHKALEPFVGKWNYTGQWWMSPDTAPESMTGSADNSLIFGGRFLKQEFRGEAQGQPPFEGLGYTGYDNIRKEYQTVWFDNMATGIMTGTGAFDAATKTLTNQSDFSCPMTGEAHRQMRSAWKVVDADHNTYESYMRTPDGREFKSMEIRYTRAQ